MKFDDATKCNQSPILCSAIIRDEESNMIRAMAILLGTQTNHMV